MKIRALLMVGLSTFLFARSLPAEIIGGLVTGGSAYFQGGTFEKLTPPLTNLFGATNSVGIDNFQSTNLYGCDEVQYFVLTSKLVVDVDAGTNPIPIGTAVASHYVFFDPGTNLDVAGKVGFDTNVLGVIHSTTNLFASDYLANPAVNYLGTAARGLEPGDSVIISAPQQIMVQLSAGSPGDYIRVITSSTKMPDPTVSIVNVGTNLVISWLTNATGFNLQYATNLSGAVVWVNHPNKPVTINHEFKITNAISGNNTFFRLSKR